MDASQPSPPSRMDPQGPALGEIAGRLREDVGLLRTALDRQRRVIETGVRNLVDEHPVAALAGSFGIGYVLGGGLLSRLTIPAIGIALRAAAGELLGTLVAEIDQRRTGTSA